MKVVFKDGCGLSDITEYSFNNMVKSTQHMGLNANILVLAALG